MRYLELDGRRLSRIGLGCWQFGESGWGYGQDFGPKDSIAIIRRALELGVTVLDTAELYGSGASESLVGAALQGWGEPVFLASKFTPLLPLPPVIVSHCRRSLTRLERASLDLYQLHFPNPAVPIRVQMDGLRQVLRAGLTQHVGVSNYSLSRWRRAERLLGSPIISNQVRYNLLQRKPERELLEFAARTKHIVIAYSPLAQGALSGRYGKGNVPTGVRRGNRLFTEVGLSAAEPLMEVVREIAAGRNVTPSQVALAYLIAQPQVIAIPGAKSIAQLEANVAAAEIELSADEMLALRRGADLFQLSKTKAAAQLIGGFWHQGQPTPV